MNHYGKPDGCGYVPACGAESLQVTRVRGGVTCPRCRAGMPDTTDPGAVHKAGRGGRPACHADIGRAAYTSPALAYRWAGVTCFDCLAMRRKRGGYAY